MSEKVREIPFYARYDRYDFYFEPWEPINKKDIPREYHKFVNKHGYAPVPVLRHLGIPHINKRLAAVKESPKLTRPPHTGIIQPGTELHQQITQVILSDPALKEAYPLTKKGMPAVTIASFPANVYADKLPKADRSKRVKHKTIAILNPAPVEVGTWKNVPLRKKYRRG